MKYVKIIGLLAVAAAALMAFAGSASATTLTVEGKAYTGPIHATAEGHALLHNPIAKIECPSTVSGTVEKHGAGSTVSGAITTLIFGTAATEGCTGGWVIHVIKTGTLEVHYKAKHEGTLTSDGATVEGTRLGIICRYKTENTDIGTITDSNTAGDPKPSDETKTGTATLHIEANIPFDGGSALCGATPTAWTGSYKVNTPDHIVLDE